MVNLLEVEDEEILWSICDCGLRVGVGLYTSLRPREPGRYWGSQWRVRLFFFIFFTLLPWTMESQKPKLRKRDERKLEIGFQRQNKKEIIKILLKL